LAGGLAAESIAAAAATAAPPPTPRRPAQQQQHCSAIGAGHSGLEARSGLNASRSGSNRKLSKAGSPAGPPALEHFHFTCLNWRKHNRPNRPAGKFFYYAIHMEILGLAIIARNEKNSFPELAPETLVLVQALLLKNWECLA